MSRLQGEVVQVMELIGRDYRGRPEYAQTPLKAVVVPGGRDIASSSDDNAGWLNTAEITLLLTGFHDLEAGTQIEVRGRTYYVDGDTFDHQSAFGTTRGGTEIKLTSEEVIA